MIITIRTYSITTQNGTTYRIFTKELLKRYKKTKYFKKEVISMQQECEAKIKISINNI